LKPHQIEIFVHYSSPSFTVRPALVWGIFVSTATIPSVEKPQNGLVGLKYWRYDLRSGFMVAMISLPFSMGIAITSGAPPVCGIVSAIVAGFVLPFLGGSYVTISGPAAGLAPALYAGMILLGGTLLGTNAKKEEMLQAGYPMVLVAILLTGVAQVGLAKLRVARLSTIFPVAAIEGMLVAIGLLIIVKQIPLFMGTSFEAHEFWEILAETPHQLSSTNWQVFGLGLACLAALFILAAVPWRLLQLMPPPVWVFAIGTLFSRFFLRLDQSYLINVPEAPLKNGIILPDFRPFFEHPQLWLPLAYLVVTLVLIDGTESLATIFAVDKIDPFRRRSNPDRTLFSMGVSNVCSSTVGGLTIIPGIVKSTANIIGGGRTQWANFYNACFLLVFLILGRNQINMIPKTVLASILVFIGFKLCRPKVWVHVAHIGTEQFLVFAATALITVTTDLLVGIAAGVVLELILTLWYVGIWYKLSDGISHVDHPGVFARFLGLFRNPVRKREYKEGVYNLYFDRPMVCFNLFHVIREMERIPADATQVCLHLTDDVTLLDHTTGEILRHYMREFDGDEKPMLLRIRGLEGMRPLSRHESCVRLARLLTKDREEDEGSIVEPAAE
jgi:carbonic anhydrase